MNKEVWFDQLKDIEVLEGVLKKHELRCKLLRMEIKRLREGIV